MNRDQFHQYVNSPERLNAESLQQLDELVKEYPYFQAGRMLFVKNLKNEDNIRFNKQLKIAAACIHNRQLLFGLLNRIRISEDGSFFPLSVASGEEVETIEGMESVFPMEAGSGEDILSLMEEDTGKEDLPKISDKPQYQNKAIYIKELERYIPVADLDLLLIDIPIGDPDILDFDFESTLPEIKDDSISIDKDQEVKRKEFQGISSRDLIDDFIRNNPRMPQPGQTSSKTDDFIPGSLEESDAFMTETLAEIYLKQGYYYRALQAYEKLSLKYPQKSIYFASQIQKIKELISKQ